MANGCCGNSPEPKDDKPKDSRLIINCFVFIDKDDEPIFETLGGSKDDARDKLFLYLKRKKPKTTRAQKKILDMFRKQGWYRLRQAALTVHTKSVP